MVPSGDRTDYTTCPLVPPYLPVPSIRKLGCSGGLAHTPRQEEKKKKEPADQRRNLPVPFSHKPACCMCADSWTPGGCHCHHTLGGTGLCHRRTLPHFSYLPPPPVAYVFYIGTYLLPALSFLPCHLVLEQFLDACGGTFSGGERRRRGRNLALPPHLPAGTDSTFRLQNFVTLDRLNRSLPPMNIPPPPHGTTTAHHRLVPTELPYLTIVSSPTDYPTHLVFNYFWTWNYYSYSADSEHS